MRTLIAAIAGLVVRGVAGQETIEVEATVVVYDADEDD